MSVLASTNSFTIPLLPGVPLDLVQEFLHPRAGQPRLLDLLADCFEELVVLAQSPDHGGSANQRPLAIVPPPAAPCLPQLFWQGPLPRRCYLADVRLRRVSARVTLEMAADLIESTWSLRDAGDAALVRRGG